MSLLLLLACVESGGVSGPHDVDGVVWSTAWDTGGVSREEEGWRVTTDAGAVIELTGGYLVDSSFSLVTCDLMASRAVPIALGLLAPSAQADHSSEVDPSASVAAVATSLTALEASTQAGLSFEAGSYCGVYVRASPAEAGTVDLPAEPDLIGSTFWMTGRAFLPSGEVRELSLTSAAADGRLYDLVLDEASDEAASLEITVRRDAATAFDGIDFASDTDATIAWRVLENLLDDLSLDAVRASQR